MNDPLRGRRVVLGVTGSIAAYKALTVASRLAASDALVDVILTEAAQHLVQPLAFQALTHRPVITSMWQPVGQMALDHVALARAADALVVAPASAHTIARLALGMADDALSTTALAATAPLVVAPAMEPHMWSHPATQEHVAVLRARGALIVGPAEGRMASGQQGVGRMVEPADVLEHLRLLFAAAGDLAGRRVLLSAGPTVEPIDPVRFVANRSSGRMGYAIARAARDRGARVSLVSGPVELQAPLGVDVVRVETAVEMRDALLGRVADADAIIMAAAVADFRPAEPETRKIKKGGGTPAAVRLEANPDILVEIGARIASVPAERRPVRIGFAAETDDLVRNARDKLLRKGLDLVVANPVPASFAGDGAESTLVDDTDAIELGWRPKEEIAHAVLDRLAALLARREKAPP